MKKGFTLIELLAVIVILAIIAVIAVPIVLNIIDESKKNATLRSADFYLDAVEYAIANRVLDNRSIDDGEYKILKSGNICLAYDADNKCIDELVVDMNGEKPTSGIVIIEKGQIVGNSSNNTEKKTTMTIGTNTIVYNTTEKEYVIEKQIIEENTAICKAVTSSKVGTVPQGNYVSGDEYVCEVKPGTKYNFFVLSTNKDTGGNVESVNLLMAHNITQTGEPITQDTSSDVIAASQTAWLSESDYTGTGSFSGCLSADIEVYPTQEGPKTAMNYLNQATSSWRDELKLNETYTDSVYENFSLTGKARLPKKAEMSSIGCKLSDGGSCPLWSVDNGGEMDYYFDGKQVIIPGIMTYWLMDAAKGGQNQCDSNSWESYGATAYYIQHGPAILDDFPHITTNAGIRPVITVSIDMIG